MTENQKKQWQRGEAFNTAICKDISSAGKRFAKGLSLEI